MKATGATLFDFDRRIARAIETGRGTMLSPSDQEWLVASGAIETFRAFVADQQRKLCAERSARRHSISAETSASTGGPTGLTSKSSGTTPSPDANEALQRAQAMTNARG